MVTNRCRNFTSAYPNHLSPMITKHFTCPLCHSNNRLRTFAPDRVELEKERGETFTATCKHCSKPVSIHVNQVRAKPMKSITFVVSILLVALIVVAFLMGFMTNIYGLLLLSGVLGIPVMVNRAVIKSADTFNSYYLTE
ncbi:MAG: hypothetical protein AAF597_01255 [Bacteroidota bacterium]